MREVLETGLAGIRRNKELVDKLITAGVTPENRLDVVRAIFDDSTIPFERRFVLVHAINDGHTVTLAHVNRRRKSLQAESRFFQELDEWLPPDKEPTEEEEEEEELQTYLPQPGECDREFTLKLIERLKAQVAADTPPVSKPVPRPPVSLEAIAANPLIARAKALLKTK